MNCFWVPVAMLASAGVTAIEAKVAPLTFRETASDATASSVAVISVAPTLDPVASPVLLTVATMGVPDSHDTESVMSCNELSEYTPVATRLTDVPRAILGDAGVTPIDTRCAPVTVKVVVPAMPPAAAVIVIDPGDTPVTAPLALIVATAVSDDVQVTLDKKSCLEPSL